MPASVLPSPIGASISTTEMRSSVSPNRTSMSSCNPRRPFRGMLGQTSLNSRPKSTSNPQSPLSSRNRSTFCSASAQVFSGSNHVSASAKRSPDAIQSDKIVRPSSGGSLPGFFDRRKEYDLRFQKKMPHGLFQLGLQPVPKRTVFRMFAAAFSIFPLVVRP